MKYEVTISTVSHHIKYFVCTKVELKSGALLLYNCYEQGDPQNSRFIKAHSINNLITFEVEEIK